jgi:hypothetical protein
MTFMNAHFCPVQQVTSQQGQHIDHKENGNTRSQDRLSTTCSAAIQLTLTDSNHSLRNRKTV